MAVHFRFNFDNIPQSMREEQRWTCFRVTQDPRPEEPWHLAKQPFNPLTGTHSERDDPASWCDFETCRKAVQIGTYQALAYASGDGIVVTDIDGDAWQDDSGTITEYAREIIRQFDPCTYIERSLSGHGGHILASGDLPEGKNLTADKRHGLCEMYGGDSGRRGDDGHLLNAPQFIIMTGNLLDSRHVNLSAQEAAIRAVYTAEVKHRAESRQESGEAVMVSPAAPADLRAEDPAERISDDTVIERIAQNPKYAPLWDGQFGSDRSADDQSLCDAIALLCGGNSVQTLRIMKKSGLYLTRPEHWQSGNGKPNSYAQHTIGKACALARQAGQSQATRTLPPAPNVRIDSVTGELLDPLPEFRPFVPIGTIGAIDMSGLSEMKKFPLDALPAYCSRMCGEIVRSMGCSAELPACACLAVMSLCLTGRFLLRVTGSYTEHPNLYILLGADPSSMKSPVQDILFKPVWETQSGHNALIADQIAEYRDSLDIAERKLDFVKTAFIRGNKAHPEKAVARSAVNEAREILQDLKSHPVKPIDLIASDSTTEAMAAMMQDHYEVMSLVSSEAVTLQILMGLYSNGKPNLDLPLNAWSGSHVSIRRMGRDSIDLSSPLMTICLFVQPSVISELLENKAMTGRGMLQRFLYSLPRSLAGMHSGFITQGISPDVMESYSENVSRMVNEYQIENAGKPPVTVDMSEEAIALYCDYWLTLERACRGATETLQECLVKMKAQALRLALILHLCGGYESFEPVTGATMQKAIDVTEYFRHQASAVFADLSDDITDAKIVLSGLCHAIGVNGDNSPAVVRMRDLRRAIGSRLSSEELSAGLDVLIERGYIRRYKVTVSGRRPSDQIEFSSEALKNAGVQTGGEE